jgi:hypothetical protein
MTIEIQEEFQAYSRNLEMLPIEVLSGSHESGDFQEIREEFRQLFGSKGKK